jgi:hypothetical protein
MTRNLPNASSRREGGKAPINDPARKATKKSTELENLPTSNKAANPPSGTVTAMSAPANAEIPRDTPSVWPQEGQETRLNGPSVNIFQMEAAGRQHIGQRTVANLSPPPAALYRL